MWSLGNSSWRATRIRVFSVEKSPFGSALRLEAKRRRINNVSDAWKPTMPIFAVARWKISMLFTYSGKEEKRLCFHPHPNHRYHDTWFWVRWSGCFRFSEIAELYTFQNTESLGTLISQSKPIIRSPWIFTLRSNANFCPQFEIEPSNIPKKKPTYVNLFQPAMRHLS